MKPSFNRLINEIKCPVLFLFFKGSMTVVPAIILTSITAPCWQMYRRSRNKTIGWLPS